MAKIVTHKRVKDNDGNRYPLCQGGGNVETRYTWAKVTCKRCLAAGIRSNFNSRQLHEIARLRRAKIKLSEIGGK